MRVDVFYSMRSPYCYLLTPRLVELDRNPGVEVRIRPVYPLAVRDPGFFRRVDPLYRPYHLLDSRRLAEFLGLPYRRPRPDPIVQDMETNEIAPQQPLIHRLTRLAQAAAEAGRSLAFAEHVMTLLWDGRTDGWDQGEHLARAVAEAGLDLAELDAATQAEPARYDAAIEAHQEAQRRAGHWGVPLMVFEDEPFYGQDRFELLLWRMRQRGLSI